MADEHLEKWRNLRGIERLYLDETQITNVGLLHLRGLSSLKLLSLDNTGITDDGLAVLSKFKSLESLSLKGTGIDGSGLAPLQDMALRIWCSERTRMDVPAWSICVILNPCTGSILPRHLLRTPDWCI
ncbi:MAG: hypothetical protein U0992_10135 [Planctomycetaceae bacterium]